MTDEFEADKRFLDWTDKNLIFLPRSQGRVLREGQRRWAQARGIKASQAGYVDEAKDNLFDQMHPETAREFGRGSGGELRRSNRGRPPKFLALHSSSALACNVFDYWRARDLSSLQAALELSEPITKLAFEAQFSTGLRGEPPNLDVALTHPSGRITALECKFTEPFSSRRKSPAFKPKYFPDGVPVWQQYGLSRLAVLADRMQRGKASYSYLDAAQLMKHALGLQVQTHGQFMLVYIYMGGTTEGDVRHAEEIADFEGNVGADIAFTSITYDTLVSRMASLVGTEHKRYFDYLVARYLAVSSQGHG